MECCCDGFKRLLLNAGNKGFSVICENNEKTFYLEARPFAPDVIEKYSSPDTETGYVKWPKLSDSKGQIVPYVSSIKIQISYCPICGKSLKKRKFSFFN